MAILFLCLISLVSVQAILPVSDTSFNQEQLLSSKDIHIFRMSYPYEHKPLHAKENIRTEQNSSIPVEQTTYFPSSASNSGPMNSSWPMKSFNQRRVGRSPHSTANNPGVEKWQYLNLWGIDAGIVISDNDNIYFGGKDWYVYALYSNGTLRWRYKTREPIYSTPAIAEDGTVYIGSCDWYLYAMNPNGTLKWSFGIQAISFSSPVIANDGTIYTGNVDGKLFAVYPNGTCQWYYDAMSGIYGDPALGSDGTIYFGTWDNYLYAVNSNGTLKWRFLTGNHVKGIPSIALDGTIYFGSWDGYLYALYPNGTMRWRCKVGSGTETTPAIATDGTIYVGGDDLYAVYPNGTMRWVFSLGPDRHIFQSCPAVSADGTIYVGVDVGEVSAGEIVAVNPDGTERWRKIISDEWTDSSPAIAADGTVYIGSVGIYMGGGLHAFGRGPLNVDANGPYTGYYHIPVQFIGTIFGGIPPYSCHWDFGDGQTSNEQNPSHNYSAVGNFTATFTVVDSEGNSSSDTATVSVSYELPSVTITKPVKGIYLMDKRVFPSRKYVIIGRITIEADAHQDPLGIARVEFAIDGKLKATDTEAPYSWMWRTPSFSKHTVTVTAYDTSGKSSATSIVVWKFF